VYLQYKPLDQSLVEVDGETHHTVQRSVSSSRRSCRQGCSTQHSVKGASGQSGDLLALDPDLFAETIVQYDLRDRQSVQAVRWRWAAPRTSIIARWSDLAISSLCTVEVMPERL
jgi:hypothetical protein